ncbi:hypothetical protein, partial [Rosistilla oblonga]|uniref:hypothetical protein n=1 Tax=Rosistilla oblonga TaxID=2527990 RepID=UPI003A983332
NVEISAGLADRPLLENASQRCLPGLWGLGDNHNSCGSRRRLYAAAATAASCTHSLHGFRFLRLAQQALCGRRFRGFVHAFTPRLSVPEARATGFMRSPLPRLRACIHFTARVVLRLAPQALCDRRYRGFVHAFTPRISFPAARAAGFMQPPLPRLRACIHFTAFGSCGSRPVSYTQVAENGESKGRKGQAHSWHAWRGPKVQQFA